MKNGLMRDGVPLHLLCACGAGLTAAFFGSPVEVIKTRIMTSNPGFYSGPIDCAIKTVKNEGYSALYKGIVPYAVRQMSWICVMFLTLEQLKKHTAGPRILIPD